MIRTMASFLLAGAVCCGTQAFADDTSMNSSTMTSEQKQMVKDCMAKQKANDSSMSKDVMKKTCEAQVNPQFQTGGANNSVPPTDSTKPH